MHDEYDKQQRVSTFKPTPQPSAVTCKEVCVRIGRHVNTVGRRSLLKGRSPSTASYLHLVQIAHTKMLPSPASILYYHSMFTDTR